MNRITALTVRGSAALLPLIPVVALAQEFGEIDTFFGKITTFINNTLIPLVFAVALLMFIWGMFWYFIAKNDTDKEKGKSLAIWAIVAFVLMVSIWGIVNLIAGGLGFSGETVQNIPTAPTR